MGAELQIRAGVYGRESQGHQRSIGDQIRDGRQEAGNLGWRVVRIYSDRVSASRFAKRARDDWPRLAEDITTGAVNAVIIRDSSRADRRPSEWLAFLDLCRDRGTLIRSVTEHETFDVRKWRDYKSLADEGLRNAGEVERTRDRALVGQRHAYEAGRPPGGDCPYGYVRHRRMEGTTTVVDQVPDPDTADVVVAMFQAIRDGQPIRAVVEDLNQRGVPSPGRGDKWYPSRVKGIISNPAYVGLRKHNGDAPRPATWPPLVDQALFHAANRVLELNRRGYRPGAVEHLLSGVLRCAECSDTVGIHHGKWGRRYLCKSGKGCAAVDADMAEEYVLTALFSHLLSPHVRHSLKEQAQAGDSEFLAAQAEVDRLTGELDRFTAEAVREGLSAARLAQVERDYGQAIKEAQKRAQAASLPPPVRHFLSLNDMDGNVHEYEVTDEVVAGKRWDDMPIPARRELIRSLMWVRLHPAGKGVRRPIEDRITYGFHQ